jgi:hypothetical protein
MLRSEFRRAHLRASISDNHRDQEHPQQVRELLDAMFEIDRAYEIDLETVRTSNAPITLKQTVLDNLRQRHREHRAPYLQALKELRRRSQSFDQEPVTKVSLVNR